MEARPQVTGNEGKDLQVDLFEHDGVGDDTVTPVNNWQI